jgi:DNA transformation protein
MKNPAEGRGLFRPGLDQPFPTILFPGQHKRRRAVATLLLAKDVERAGHGRNLRRARKQGKLSSVMLRSMSRSKTSPRFPGIGPVTEQRLVDVGVIDLAALRELGAAQAYRRLKFRFGKAVTLNALYGLEAVLTQCHWRAITQPRKAELQREVEALGES